MSLGKIAVAAATFASVTLLSFGWSDQRGASLSVASAQAQEQAQTKARESHEMTSKKMTSKKMTSKEMTLRHARMSPRHERYAERPMARREYGEGRMAHPYYGPNPVQAGADVAAGAVNTAGAVAAGAVNTAGAIVGAATSPYDAYASGPYAGMDNGYYASSTWGDYECQPGWAGCKPYSAKGWK